MVEAAYQALPKGWIQVVVAALPPAVQQPGPLTLGPPDWVAMEGAVREVVACLGWGQRQRVLLAGRPAPEDGRRVVPLSVRAATALQVAPALEAQRQARLEYAASALAEGMGAVPGQQAVQEAAAALGKSMKVLWRLGWENERRETLWRLSVNGVAAAGGHDVCLGGPCKCGWVGPPGDGGLSARKRAFAWRSHHFWSCPIARAVVSELLSALPAQAQLVCADVWLMRPPAGVYAGVWGLVCAAAVEAMEFGRKLAWALDLGGAAAPGGPSQTLITSFFPRVSVGDSPPSAVVQRAARKAAAWFWCLIQDFVSLQRVPVDWLSKMGPTHAFVGVTGGSQLCLCPPPGLALPDQVV